MQILAIIGFWVLASLALGIIQIVLLLLGLLPSLRERCGALREATTRSWFGALYMQAIGFLLMIPLLLLTWGIQAAAASLGASQEIAVLCAMPIGLVALALPPIATVLGAVHGLKAGWFEATGRDSELELLRGRSARWMQRVGLGWAAP